MDFHIGQVLLFNKPKGWTSFDVVNKVRGVLRSHTGNKKIKVGHAGTLDPLATGLLIVCTGPATKQIHTFQDLDKGYEVIFKLGATTASYDAEQPEENLTDASHITEAQLREAMAKFEGQIEQLPPIFSAVKVDGKRAYKAAREGKEIELRPRSVRIDRFSLLEYRDPSWIKAFVRCSKGTYIRSLIHDLGQDLEVGAYILELERTFIGPYEVADAWEVEGFDERIREISE